MEAPAARSPQRSSTSLTAAAHIFALASFAVAQPLFDLLSRQAEFFVAHDAQPLDLTLIALLLGVALPASLHVLARSVAWLHRSAGQWAHLALVAGLSGLIALQLIKRLAPGAPGRLLIVAAAALAVASAASYRRWSAVRTFLTFVSPAALLFPLFFLLTSPVRQMLLPRVADWSGEQGGTAGAPVVMVILDELPLVSLLNASHEIDPLRYPNFAALARDAYWFRDATTVAGSTVLSVPIILSGQLPDRLERPLAEHYPNNLFTWLAGAGYRLNVFETHSRLCPRELCSRETTRRSFGERFDAVATDLVVVYLHLLLPADQAARLPAIDATWHNFADRTIGSRLKQLLGTAPETAHTGVRRHTPWLFAKFLESITPHDHDPPVLHFIHLMLPHLPWRYLPSGREYGPIGASIMPHGLVDKTWGGDSWEVIQGQQRHLLQLVYVDSLVGRLLARLKKQDLYDSALIVLVADHGASFHPGGQWRRPTDEQFADVLGVPLFVKLPGQKQGVLSERNVETIDIVPTVADALDLTLPWPADGQSAIDSGLAERPSKFILRKLRSGSPVRKSWDIEALRAVREQSLARKLRIFGSDAGPNGLFRIGDRADLLGRRVSEIGIAGAPTAAEPTTDVELDQVWAYREVDPDSFFIPAHVTGRARFARPRDAPMELAVAVNGTVEAVTRTFGHDGDGARFTAMVREEAFVAGRNQVEVFEIRDRRDAAALVPTRQPSSADFTLVETAGREALRTADGLRIPLVEGHVWGYFKVRNSSLGTKLSGLAIGDERVAAETLLVFVGDRLAIVTKNGMTPDERRGRAMESWRRKASFQFRAPDALMKGSDEIRMFAILGNAASEIPLKSAPARRKV